MDDNHRRISRVVFSFVPNLWPTTAILAAKKVRAFFSNWINVDFAHIWLTIKRLAIDKEVERLGFPIVRHTAQNRPPALSAFASSRTDGVDKAASPRTSTPGRGLRRVQVKSMTPTAVAVKERWGNRKAPCVIRGMVGKEGVGVMRPPGD